MEILNLEQKKELILGFETLLSLYSDNEKKLSFWYNDNFYNDLDLTNKLLNIEINYFAQFFCNWLTYEDRVKLMTMTNEEALKEFIFLLI